MGTFSAWSLFLVVSLLAVKGLSQDLDLSDALGGDDNTDVASTPKPAAPAVDKDTGKKDLDLTDVFDNEEENTPKPPPAKTTPKATKAPAKAKPKPAADEFDLSDALDPNNDIGGKDKNKGQADKGTGEGGRGGSSPNNRGGTGGGTFSDDDLLGVGEDSSYKPDKGKGGRREDPVAPADDSNQDTMAETGTIAGIISAVGLALVGAVTSYISYQKKKFCFSIQQSLQNAGAGDLVKAEAPDAVVATEPQVQQTLLEPASAEPPSEENAV